MKSIILTSALVLTAATASAQDGKCNSPGCQMADTVFGSIESSPEGMIDQGEFVQFGRDMFVSMDSDDSKSITYDE